MARDTRRERMGRVATRRDATDSRVLVRTDFDVVVGHRDCATILMMHSADLVDARLRREFEQWERSRRSRVLPQLRAVLFESHSWPRARIAELLALDAEVHAGRAAASKLEPLIRELCALLVAKRGSVSAATEALLAELRARLEELQHTPAHLTVDGRLFAAPFVVALVLIGRWCRP